MPRKRPAAPGAALKLEDFLPYRLSVAAHAVSALIATAYERRFGIQLPQWRVLSIVSSRSGMRQQDIVPLSTMDKQTVSRAVRHLLQRGLLERREHPGDGRAWTLRLSPAGRRLYAQVAPLALEYERMLKRALQPLRPAAFEHGLRNLQLLAERLSTQQEAPARRRRKS